MQTSSKMISRHFDWTAQGGQVVNGEGLCVARVNKGSFKNSTGTPFEPMESDCLTFALAAVPDMYRALAALVEAVDAGEIVISFTGQSYGQPSKLNKPGTLANVDSARAALDKANLWDKI